MTTYLGNLPEEQLVCNLRQPRLKRVIENTFGVLASRSRILNTLINSSIENIERYMKSATVLHNYLRQTGSALFCPVGFLDCGEMDGCITKGHSRELINNNRPFNSITPLRKVYGSRYKGDAVTMLDTLKEYTNFSEGSLD